MEAQRLIPILVVLTLAAPVGAATWYGWGTYEPDTIQDHESGWQRRDADQDPTGGKLYFNAYPTEYLTSTNPNSGTAGSRFLTPGARGYYAMLGVWKDCNGDQTVGLAESALTVYRAEALIDRDICPAGSLHNDGQWVFEFLPIGQGVETAYSVHPKEIEDPDARVWGDFGLPGAGPRATCPIIPPPHGTTSGTGWILRHADCQASKRLTGAVNTVDADGSLGLRFDDPNNPQYSDSLLNVHFPESLFGNPATGETGTLQLDSEEDGGEEESAATMFDCSGERAFELRDPTGAAPRGVVVDDPTYDGENGAIAGNYGKVSENLTDDSGAYVWVANPAPAVHDPADSWADALNGTFRGFHAGGDEDYDLSSTGGDCDTDGNDQDGDNTYAFAHQTAFFYADGTNEGNTQFAAKNKADFEMRYYNGAEAEGFTEVLGANTPNSFGLNAGTILLDPHWRAFDVYTTIPQTVDRNTLQPDGALYVTFYAKVGGAILADYAQPAGVGTYGSEACGDNDEGQHNGWECDAALWWLDSNGDDIGTHWTVPVGTQYQFRDIDCDDGTVARGVPVHASLVDLTDVGPCPDAPMG